MKVVNSLKVLEVNGKSTETIKNPPTVEISNHWVFGDWVVLKIAGAEVTLLADEVVTAVRNATSKRK